MVKATEAFEDVPELHLVLPACVGDAALRKLPTLHTVKCLTVEWKEVSDEGRHGIRRLPNLHSWRLNETKVQGPGMAALSGLKQL